MGFNVSCTEFEKQVTRNKFIILMNLLSLVFFIVLNIKFRVSRLIKLAPISDVSIAVKSLFHNGNHYGRNAKIFLNTTFFNKNFDNISLHKAISRLLTKLSIIVAAIELFKTEHTTDNNIIIPILLSANNTLLQKNLFRINHNKFI